MNAPMSPIVPSSPDLLERDARNRETAIDPSASFIIEAPAGAGKTELLTQRFLALLSTVDDPEEIIALTFTNKAAAEMRARILGSLESAANGIPPDDDAPPHKRTTYTLSRAALDADRQKQWGLLQHPGRLQVTTLDALCGKLARQMPFLSRFGSQPAISTDNELHYRQAARNTLDLLEDGGLAGELIARVLACFDNDATRLQSLLESMLASRDQWLGHAHRHDGNRGVFSAEDAFKRLVSDELVAIAKVFPPSLQIQIMPAVRYAAAQAFMARSQSKLPAKLEPLIRLDNWSEPLTGQIGELFEWRGLIELLLTGEGTLRNRHPNNLGFSEKEAKPLAQALKAGLDALRESGTETTLARIRKLPWPAYDGGEWQLIEDLIALLKIATGQLWLVFKDAGQVDFTQVAQNALLALGDDEAPTDLQLQLDYRIRHLLVDEFQDTSPTQVDLLEKLTAGWEPGDGRTLFLVGDPMQSIYRFRKADVSLFLEVREHGIGQVQLTPLQLYRNNRSHQEVVEWVNEAFPAIFVGGDNRRQGSVKFSPAAATKGSHPAAEVKIHPVIAQSKDEIESEDAPLNPADQREAEQIVTLIRQARQHDPNGSIAILVRARSHLSALVTELRQIGKELPYQAVEIEALSDRQAIQDLAALTRALYHRADRVNWLAILRAPWCGLKLEDLHRLAADDHKSTIWTLMQDEARLSTLSADGQQRLCHVRNVLAEAFAHQGRQRPRRWVEGVWQSLGGPLCLEQESDTLDVQAYFKLLDALENRGQLDIGRLDAELDKLYAAPDPTAGPEAVQIMTIHKSKGLEFDTVILPGLHKSSPPEDKRLLVWDDVLMDDGDEYLVVAPIPLEKENGDGAPSKYDFLREFEKARSENEKQRLLYVAVTRAKRQVHLLGIAKPDPKEEDGLLKAPGKGTALGLLWTTVKGDFEAAAQAQREREKSGTRAGVPIDSATFIPKLVRLAHPALPAALQGSAADTYPENAEVTEEIDAMDGEVHSIEADIGTLVHRYLELIATDGLDAWSTSRVESLEAQFAQWFEKQGHGAEDSLQAAAEVKHNLVTALNSATGRWILGPHESAGCEVPITSTEDGVTQSHIVDRTFVENGVRWIIDYKTTRYDGDDLDGFLKEKAESYRGQLERYASLYGQTEMQLKTGLYFIGYDKFFNC